MDDKMPLKTPVTAPLSKYPAALGDGAEFIMLSNLHQSNNIIIT